MKQSVKRVEGLIREEYFDYAIIDTSGVVKVVDDIRQASREAMQLLKLRLREDVVAIMPHLTVRMVASVAALVVGVRVKPFERMDQATAYLNDRLPR